VARNSLIDQRTCVGILKKQADRYCHAPSLEKLMAVDHGKRRGLESQSQLSLPHHLTQKCRASPAKPHKIKIGKSRRIMAPRTSLSGTGAAGKHGGRFYGDTTAISISCAFLLPSGSTERHRFVAAAAGPLPALADGAATPTPHTGRFERSGKRQEHPKCCASFCSNITWWRAAVLRSTPHAAEK